MGHIFHENVLKAIEIMPSHPLAHLSLGIFLLSVTKKVPPLKRTAAAWVYGRAPPPASFPEALESLKKANDLYPRYFILFNSVTEYLTIIMLYSNGNIIFTLILCSSQFGRASITGLLLEAECHVALGDLDSARRRYNEAIAAPTFVGGDSEMQAEARTALAKLG